MDEETGDIQISVSTFSALAAPKTWDFVDRVSQATVVGREGRKASEVFLHFSHLIYERKNRTKPKMSLEMYIR